MYLSVVMEIVWLPCINQKREWYHLFIVMISLLAESLLEQPDKVTNAAPAKTVVITNPSFLNFKIFSFA